MIHELGFTEDGIEQLKVLDADAKKKLFTNFIVPIRNGFSPAELDGKYKPSWEMQFVDSVMKQAFMEKAKEDCLYHYHFGYKYYQDGKDPVYSGKVSDGIVHIRQHENEACIQHVIFDICLKHPSPFKVPFMKSNGKVVGL